jgi:adenosylmethionine-8-amino-7-oxononanoate aminotransferase
MLARFFYAFGLGPKVQTIRLYMRSGNVILIDKVLTCNWRYHGDTITSFSMTQRSDARHNLQVQSLNLSQIEAMVVEE